jgi:glyceraldehyde 3-phosphate dehydrogenase
MKRIAINGFGRIGRTFVRKIQPNDNIEIIAINDLTPPATLAHLLKYDSVHGRFNGTVSHTDHSVIINGKEIPITSEKDPINLPWKALNIDIVIESTGHFTKEEDAKKHITAGAKKVIISAPATGDLKTIVLGVNEGILNGDELVISNASCTTNNAAPMIK